MTTLKKMFAFTMTVALLLIPFPTSFAADHYSDTAGHWANAEIDKWSDFGVIKGSEGFFRPNDPITRAELAAILNRIMIYQQTADNEFSDLPEKWYTNDILALNVTDFIGCSLKAPHLHRPQAKLGIKVMASVPVKIAI